jgi:hypothetical protein
MKPIETRKLDSNNIRSALLDEFKMLSELEYRMLCQRAAIRNPPTLAEVVRRLCGDQDPSDRLTLDGDPLRAGSSWTEVVDLVSVVLAERNRVG